MVTTEFDIIKRYFWKAPMSPYVTLGVGDDAAILDIPEDCELVSSVDSFNEGVHFPKGTPAADVGYKSLAVSLSDMAAMGATPVAVQMALSLPAVDEAWVQDFATGFLALAATHAVDLIGGDTTRGALSISTVLYGIAPKGSSLKRHAAQAGDDVYVTGALGGAGWALARFMKGELSVDDPALQALHRPVPRVHLGALLRDYAHAAIDVSDGLLSDLGHVLSASGKGAVLSCDALPVASQLKCDLDLPAQWTYALTAGDDYELCFTAPSECRESIIVCAQQSGTPCTRVGQITEEPELRLLDASGAPFIIEGSGYEHFSGK